jgi:hypothetical protein
MHAVDSLFVAHCSLLGSAFRAGGVARDERVRCRHGLTHKNPKLMEQSFYQRLNRLPACWGGRGCR